MELIEGLRAKGTAPHLRSPTNFAKDPLKRRQDCRINLAGSQTEVEFKECALPSRSTSRNLFSLKIALSCTSRGIVTCDSPVAHLSPPIYSRVPPAKINRIRA